MTAQASNVQREPSMEEILASIRRIIEDSDTARNEDPVIGMGFGEDGAPASSQGNPDDPGEAADLDSFLHDDSPSYGENDDAPPRSMTQIQAGKHRASSLGAEIHPHPAIGKAGEPDEYLQDEALEIPESRSYGQAIPSAAVLQDDDCEEEQAETSEFSADPRVDMIAESEMFTAMRDVADANEQAHQLGEAKTLNDPSSIISDDASRQVTAAFGELSEAMEANRRRQMDQMAREMLRPMLQEWLDNNLPTLVEKLVREEIARVARGG